MRGSTVVRIVPKNERTLPIGRVDCNRGDLNKDLVLANGGNGTLFCLDGRVRLDDDRSMGLWDFEVGHVEVGRSSVRVEMYGAQ